MRAVQDTNDAAFGALCAKSPGAALDFCHDMVAVHGVFDGVTWNEDVAIELRHGDVGHDKAVTIVMQNQAAFYLIAIREGRSWQRLRRLRTLLLARGSAIRLAAREAITATWQFFDGVAFLEFQKHIEERASVSLL